MNDDKAWDRIVDAVDTKFGIESHGRTTRPLEDAPDLTEKVAHIVFVRDGERFKLERVAGPAIIDRRTVGARRAGANVRHENVYDATETSFRTDLFRDQAGAWIAVDPATLGL